MNTMKYACLALAFSAAVLRAAPIPISVEKGKWSLESRSNVDSRFVVENGELVLERKSGGYKLRAFRDLTVAKGAHQVLTLEVKVDGPGEAYAWVYSGKEDGSWDEVKLARSERVKQGAATTLKLGVPSPGKDFSRLRVSLFLEGAASSAVFRAIQYEEVRAEALPKPKDEPMKKEAAAGVWRPSDADVFAQLNLEFPGLAAVKAAVAKGDLEGAKTAYLEFRRKARKGRWTIDPGARPTTAKSKDYPQADRTMKHYFQPWGPDSEGFLGDDIDWDTNPVPKSSPLFNIEWTARLNRMTHWNVLSQAYWATLDEKYAVEWVAQMMDWVEDNPVLPSLGNRVEPAAWNTLSAGLRMAESWMDAYFSFRESPSFTPAANFAFLKGVIAHGLRLDWVADGYLKTPRSGGNWATAEMNGLGTIAILYPELNRSADWGKRAFACLAKELDAQVYPDGAQIELAPGYHQMARNLFAGIARTALLNGVALPNDYIEKMKKMYLFDLYLMDQAWKLPPLNDSGTSSAAAGLVVAAGLWSNDLEIRFGATSGKEGKAPPASFAFPYAGYRVMRSGWDKNDHTLVFDTGPVGYGHWHEDMLTLFLTSGGKPLLIEAGVRMYEQSPYREYSLSTRSHNTLTVDGKEQRRGDDHDPITAPLAWPWLSTPFADIAAAAYTNGWQATRFVAKVYYPKEFYGEKDFSVSHTRTIFYAKPYYWLVLDAVEGSGSHRCDSHFHLDAPEATYDARTRAIHSERPDVRLGLYLVDREAPSVKILKGQDDPVYGWTFNSTTKRPIPTVILTREKAAPAVFSTLLYPYRGEAPAVDSRELPGKPGVVARALQTPMEELCAVRNTGGGVWASTEKNGWSFACDAPLLLARKPKATQDLIYNLQGMTKFESKRVSLAFPSPVSLVVVETADGKIRFHNPGAIELKGAVTAPQALKVNLPPQSWMELSASGAVPCPALAPLSMKSDKAMKGTPYAEYAAGSPNGSRKPAGAFVLMQAEDMIVEGSGVEVHRGKMGCKTPCIFHWDNAGQRLEKRVEVEEGVYRILLRYCSGETPVRRLLVDGKEPFAEAGEVEFPSTQKAPPSDGWSNKTDDWECVILGEGATPGGWRIFLGKGKHTLTFVNESGSMNLDLAALVPEGMDKAAAVKLAEGAMR